MANAKPCDKCGTSIIFQKVGFKEEGKIKWKVLDAKSGEVHSRDLCEELQRIGNGNSKDESELQPAQPAPNSLQTKIIERDSNHTMFIVESPGRFAIDIKRLNGNRMS